jgi:transposase InsO family protein
VRRGERGRNRDQQFGVAGGRIVALFEVELAVTDHHGVHALTLGLPVHEMRLHIHPFEGSGDGLCGSFHRPKEPITVTPAEIIYQRRIAVLDHAQRTGNVTEACVVFGISRTRYYEWKNVADLYGLEALMPKARRKPQMPEATPTHVIETLLTLAVTQPTIGCRQYADRLLDQGFSIGKSTVQKHLVTHGLGTRAQRLAKVAAIAAATTGLVVPEVLRKDEPFGFCLATGGPGELVCLDSFYIGKLKGVGKVYQLTAIDVFTRFAVVSLVLGTPTGVMTARFIHQALRLYRRHGVKIRAILTDNGGEYIAGAFVEALAAKGLRHHRIPARSPNHNAVCERFQGTMLQECWRPAFHRRHFTSVRQLQAEANAWLITYNHRRRNHGDYMRGRTPHEILDNHKRNRAA